MPSLVTVSIDAAIAVIRIDNPPVNGLSAAVRVGLAEALRRALMDAAVEAIIVTGAGRMFSAGADIREFAAPPSAAPTLATVVAALEASPRPVVAAIHGVAAGGGLELALGCHHRIATADTRVGLPEVTLGIVPGAGGTQRLPRLIGVEQALEMIVSGELLRAAAARERGVLDEIADGDLVAAARDAAARLAAAGATPRRTRDLTDRIHAPLPAADFFERCRADIRKKARGASAPLAAIDCVEAATRLPFEEGMARERATFERLVTSAESRAMRHVFFAERDAAKVPDVPPETPVRAIARAAVVGCGTMGSGIAMCFANAGIPVQVLDQNRTTLDRGVETIKRLYAATVAKGKLAQSEVDQRLRLIQPTLELEALADADIIIEAVFEELDLKRQVFAALDRSVKPDAALATNTSTLSVDAIASATRRPDRVVGMHFFSPANVMRLVEAVRGQKSSAETIATVMKLSARIGKIPVLVSVCDGFVGNRMLYAYRRQADALLEEGALPQQVDRVLRDFGFPMGPFAMVDLAGLDVGWRIRKRQAAEHPTRSSAPSIADRICEIGRFGQKTGAGWYRYEAGSRTPIPDPEIDRLVESVAAERGVRRRSIGDAEILERCVYALVNEGARILEEGVALRPGDIDVIWIHGYGFPRHRGGPMFWADSVGLGPVHETLRRLHGAHGEWLRPAPLLERLAREGRGFGDLGLTKGARR